MTQTVLCNKQNSIAEIIFNRPEAMNSYNKEMADELLIAAKDVAKDQSIRAVVLKGAGNLFMAGGDIQFFYENLKILDSKVGEIIETLNKTIFSFMTMPKPLLASVHGSVAGVGVSLMSACDLVIAAKDTKFTTAYSGLGISPDGGATYNLPHIVGTKKAMEWLLLSEIFSADIAKEHGLINWVVDSAELEKTTQKLMLQLSNGPTMSFARTKRLVNQSLYNDLRKHLEMEGKSFEECTKSQDFKSGVEGFLQKTKPTFVGE